MRLSHRDLEQVRIDAAGYLRERMRGQQYGGRPSAFWLWQLSVYVFHRHRENLVVARQYLEDAFRRNYVAGLAQERRIRTYVEYLERYARAFVALGHTAVSTRVRVRWVIVHNIEVGGEIGRVDLTPSGYALCLLTRKRSNRWREELRMPILQNVMANRLGVPTSVIVTGLYDVESGAHDWHSFSDGEIAAAVEEATLLAERLSGAAVRVGYTL